MEIHTHTFCIYVIHLSGRASEMHPTSIPTAGQLWFFSTFYFSPSIQISEHCFEIS